MNICTYVYQRIYVYSKDFEALTVETSQILYINQNHPKLKSMLPTWSDRIEQITKIWNELSNETQKFYIDKARVNVEIRMSTQVIKE